MNPVTIISMQELFSFSIIRFHLAVFQHQEAFPGRQDHRALLPAMTSKRKSLKSPALRSLDGSAVPYHHFHKWSRNRNESS